MLMTVKDIFQTVSGHLFAGEGVNVFAVLDGASIPNLPSILYEHQPECVCLYRGELATDMAEVAPYLVRLDPGATCTEWVIGQGWGKHWGIFAVSQGNLLTLRSHFRNFLMIYDGAGNPLYFRYYDPRVMRVYLPTCNAKELKVVFGPVACYLLEDEDPNTALRFRNAFGTLQQEKLQLIKV